MKRGIRILLILLATLSLGYASFQLLHPKLLAWYFTGYCYKCFGYSIDYQSAKHAKDGSLLLKKVVATSPDFPEGELIAHRVKIAYEFDWAQRLVTASIFPDQVEIILKKSSQVKALSKNKSSFFKKKRRAFFFISPSICLQKTKGKILQGEDELLAFFEVEAEVGKESRGIFVVKDVDDKKIANGKFNELHGMLHLSIDLNDCPCSLAAQLWRKESEWEVSSGLVDGSVDLFYENRSSSLIIDLLFSHGALITTSNTALAFDAISLHHKSDLELTTLSLQNGSVKWNDLFVDSIQGNIEIKGEEIQPLSCLIGRLYGNHIELSVGGYLQDPELLLKLEGEGNRDSLKFFGKYVQEDFWDKEPIALSLHKKGSVWKGVLTLGEDAFTLFMEGKVGWKQEKGLTWDIGEAKLSSSLLSLAKYSPLMLSSRIRSSLDGYPNHFGIDGQMEIEAVFNKKRVSLNQTIHTMDLSLGHFEIHSPQPFILAYHWQDREPHPIIQGKMALLHVIDQETGLSFHEAEGNLQLDHKGIYVFDFYANVEGVAIKGNLQSLWDKNDFNIHITHVEGPFSGLKKIASKLEMPLFFHKLPLEGVLIADGEGIHYRHEFDPLHPKGKMTQLKMEGRLTDGRMQARFGNMMLDRLQLSFRYDHTANHLLIYDIEGVLLIGKEGKTDEYVVAGDKIYFADFMAQQSVFDLWVGLRNRDILRLVGTTKMESAADGEMLVHFEFDRDLTHFGVIYPKVASLTLRNWEKIEQMDFEFSFQLSTALGDLQRFVRSGFLGMSPGVTYGISGLKSAKGGFEASLHWDQKNAFFFNLKGEDIVLGSSRFNSLNLRGKKIEKLWSIEELKLDELSVSADIKNEGTNLVFPFFGFHYGSVALAGSHGVYYSEDDHLEGNIELIEVDLNQIKNIAQFKKIASLYEPKGKIKAKGRLRLDFLKQHWWRAEAYLNGKMLGLEIQGLALADIDDVAIGYLSDQGVTLQALETHLQRGDASQDIVSMHIERAGYDLRTEELWINGLRFSLPKERLEWAADRLTYVVPEMLGFSFPSDLARLLAHSKIDEPLSGRFDIRLHPRSASIKLKLNEGWYYFGRTPHFLKDTLFEFSPYEIKFSTLYYFNEQWVLFAGQTNSLDLKKGHLILSQQFQKERPLTINWKRTDEGGFWVEKAEGSVAGTEIFLQGSKEDAQKSSWKLSGEMNVHLAQAAQFFPYLGWAAMAKRWELGKGYHLIGDWVVPKNAWDKIQFEGVLKGNQAEIMGHQIDKIEAHLRLNEEGLVLLDSRIEDKAGSIEISKAVIEKLENQHWILDIPSITFHQFNPSELQRIGKRENRSKNNFVFKKLEAYGVRGYIADMRTWRATGSFSFANSAKTGEKQTLFYIPNDILKKVGMDLNALTPVTGTIEFDVEDGKIIFSKFKDVYSESKLLKFVLAKESVSTMDFNGNLNLRMTLKPYHVMFRFAEFFSVGVSGDLRKPEYNLFK